MNYNFHVMLEVQFLYTKVLSNEFIDLAGFEEVLLSHCYCVNRKSTFPVDVCVVSNANCLFHMK